jgi:hypothetical protein
MHPPFPAPATQSQQLDLVSAVTAEFFGPGGVGAAVKRFDQAYLHRKGSITGLILVGGMRIDKQDMVSLSSEFKTKGGKNEN